MSFDNDQLRSPQADAAPLHVPHFDTTAPDQALVDDPEKVFKTIADFANGGRGDGHTIPRLAKGLTFDYRIQVRGLLPALAHRISGDEVMQVGEIVEESADVTLKLALQARPALTPDQVQRHVRLLSADDLVTLGNNDAMFAEVRKRMSGPMARELPRFASFPKELHSSPQLAKWFLEGDPTVSALNLAVAGSPKLAKSLDEIQAWSWLDRLHVAQNFFLASGLELLREATGDENVKAKIGHLLGSFKVEQYGQADAEAASRDIHNNIANHGGTNALLNAGAISRSVDNADKDGVEQRLRGEPANIVLEFAFATTFELSRAIPLLANARGATADQMQLLVTSHNTDDRLAALRNDKLRAQVRKVLGARTPLIHLFTEPNEREAVHAALYKDEALRQWAYQEKNPETYLWIAAGSNHAKEACKLVQREVGYGWVHQLSPLAPNVELRRLALNCGDDKTTEYVHTHLFGDRTFKVDPSENMVGPLPGDVYGQRADSRLAFAAGAQNTDPKVILARLGDLDAAQRAAALGNAAELKAMFNALGGDDAVRAVFLLGPTIPQTFMLPIVNAPGVLDYLRTRPPAEEQQALARPSLLPRIRTIAPHTGPLVVFPSLYDPHQLAAALAKSPDMLEWLLEDTDPSLALACLSAEPARAAAATIFEARPHIYDKLPAYKHLLPQGKHGFDALAKAAHDDDAKDDAKSYQRGEVDVDGVADRHAQRMQSASGQAHLWSAIEALANQHGGEDGMLALVNNAPPKERIALLDGTHTASVRRLRDVVLRSPVHVFPGLSTAQLLALPDAADWLFEVEPSYAVLARLLPGSPAFTQLGHALDHDVARALGWVTGLPDSAGLTAHERVSLDTLSKHVTNVDVLRALFKVRFGAVGDSTFPDAELRRLWGVLARLPASQVNQHVIKTFTHGPIGATGNGMWWHDEVILDDKPSSLADNEASYEDAAVLSAADIKKYYGLDDKALEIASGKNGWIEAVRGGYRVKEVNSTPQFDATVIHEVGHSVDQLLGEHTDVIYGAGGWKTYGVDQFEEWATQMGAMQGLTGRDREDVIAAWKESFRAGKPVKDIVDAGHPALRLPRPDDPLVKAATAGEVFNYKHSRHQAFGDRVFVTRGVTLAIVPKATADVAPSEYSMSSPAEFFAECYVEYYREYQGTPETMTKKGGHLASWIKQWFDTHVDNVRLAPDRINGPAEPRAKPKPG